MSRIFAALATMSPSVVRGLSDMMGGAFWTTPPQRRMFCSNWQALLINEAEVPTTSSSGECGKLCHESDLCVQFSWQENSCSEPEGQSKGACLMMKAGCKPAANVCWDLFTMRRGGESRCLDAMLDTDPANPDMSTLSHADNPLVDLIGRWSNAPPGWKRGDRHPDIKGLNVVRLPAFNDRRHPHATFAQLLQQYVEVIEFTPIVGAIRNRGYENANHFDPACEHDQILLGLKYHQKVEDVRTGEMLHDEVGQWLFNKEPGVDVDWSVARLALIPHGQMVMAIGRHSGLDGEQAISDDINATMTDQGGGAQFGVQPLNSNLPGGGPGYARVPRPFDSVQSLLDQVEAANAPAMTALKLDVTTSVTRGPAGGSVGQMPNPKAQAFTELFNHTYWLEKWTDASGTQQMQLQYLQTFFLTFQAREGNDPTCQKAYPGIDCLIKWPHYEMNTLKKIADFPFPPSTPQFSMEAQLPMIR